MEVWLATLIERLKKKGPKTLRALLKDVRDATISWRQLHKKYGFAVATLRRHFEEERKAALGEWAAADELG